MNPMTQASGVAGVGCYADGAQVVGQCKNDGQYYCPKHGEGGYCAKCIEQARSSKPGGVGCISRLFYILGVIFALVGLAACGASASARDSSGQSALGLGVVFAIGALVWTLIFSALGRALSKGSAGLKTLIVIIAWILIILVPTVVGPIIGIAILYLLNQEPTQRWFEMRKIKREFTK